MALFRFHGAITILSSKILKIRWNLKRGVKYIINSTGIGNWQISELDSSKTELLTGDLVTPSLPALLPFLYQRTQKF